VAVNQATGTAYEAAAEALDGGWALTPSAANALSPLINVSDNAATFSTGQPGSTVITADAQPAAAFTEAGSLPAGVTLTAGGTLAGTPAAGTGGIYLITITASNGIAPDSPQVFVLTVDQPTAFTSASSATFTVGSVQAFALTTTGFPAVGDYSLQAGAFPRGIGFTDTPYFAIEGTPAAGSGGIYHLTLAAGDDVSTLATQDFSLTVDQRPAFSSAAKATFLTGRRKSVTIKTAGFPVAAVTEQGKLPHGVTFTAHPNGTATLTGTPASSARGHAFVLTLTATNSAGTVRQTFRLLVT
jgi:hypothetical protein